MVLKGDGGPIMESHDMFKLSDIKNAQVSRIKYSIYISLKKYI